MDKKGIHYANEWQGCEAVEATDLTAHEEKLPQSPPVSVFQETASLACFPKDRGKSWRLQIINFHLVILKRALQMLFRKPVQNMDIQHCGM